MNSQKLNSASPAVEAAEPILKQWIAAVQALDPAAASDLYAESGGDMAFWGTFGSHCRTTRDQAHDYFVRFLDLASLTCAIREIHWRAFGDGAALATGWYEFTLAGKGGAERRQAQARFTFGFARQGDGGWKIVEHHSSLFPEGGY